MDCNGTVELTNDEPAAGAGDSVIAGAAIPWRTDGLETTPAPPSKANSGVDSVLGRTISVGVPPCKSSPSRFWPTAGGEPTGGGGETTAALDLSPPFPTLAVASPFWKYPSRDAIFCSVSAGDEPVGESGVIADGWRLTDAPPSKACGVEGGARFANSSSIGFFMSESEPIILACSDLPANLGNNIAASTATTASSASAVTSGRISSRLSQNNSFGRGVLKCASSFSRRSPESFSAALSAESDSAGLTETSRTMPMVRLSCSYNFASPASCSIAQRRSLASSSGNSPSSSAVSFASISSRDGLSGFMAQLPFSPARRRWFSARDGG